MFVCGPDGVLPPLGPDLFLVARKDMTVDTVHANQVSQLKAHDASILLFDHHSLTRDDMTAAAASQNTHQITLITSSMRTIVGLSPRLAKYRTKNTRQITMDVTPVKICTTDENHHTSIHLVTQSNAPYS